MGLKSFSDKSGLSIQAVSDFVAERQKWSMDKISSHIKDVFKLKAKLSLKLPKLAEELHNDEGLDKKRPYNAPIKTHMKNTYERKRI